MFMQEAKAAAKNIPVFKPNMAMQSGSPGIIEAGLRAAHRDDYVAAALATSQTQARRALNLYAESLITSGKKTAKEATEDIVKSDLYKATKALEANERDWSVLDERLKGGDFFTKQDGEALIRLRNEAAARVQGVFREEYNNLYRMADDAGFRMNLGDFQSDI